MQINDEELRDLFRVESAEHLETLEQGLLRLEKDPADQSTLENVFRAAHSLKGASRMLEVHTVEAIGHRFEDLLGLAKRGQLALDTETVDRLYRGLDGIRAFVDEAVTGTPSNLELASVLQELEESATDEKPDVSDHVVRPAEIGSDVAAAESPISNAVADEKETAAEPSQDNAPAPESTPPTPQHESSSEIPDANEAVVIADPELRELFQIESQEHLQTLEDGLLLLEKEPTDTATLHTVFRSAHSLKGASRMLGAAKVEAVANRFEDVLGMARRGTIELSTDAVDRLYQALDVIREYCDECVSGAPSGSQLIDVLERLNVGELTPTASESVHEEKIEQVSTPDDTVSDFKTETGDRDSTTGGQNQPSTGQPIEPEVIDIQSRPVPTAMMRDLELPTPAPQTREVSTVAPQQLKKVAPAGRTPAEYRIDTIRVQSQKLDALMTQTGELTVTRGHIAHRVAQVERIVAAWEEWNRDSYTVRSLVSNPGDLTGASGDQLVGYLQRDRSRMEQIGNLIRQLETAVKNDDARIDLLASQLEESIREIRLLPLSTVFNLFPRLVRDLSRSLGKEIELQIQGGETSADKRILEEIKDPLTHIIRNAIDHGIELPDDRERTGKSRCATVLLRGYQSGANVTIEIRDDGCGIDLDAVRQTALRRNVVGPSELAEMTDMQIRQLIFAPGFSTKQMVTDVSGRGVGLDVVWSNVEALRGNIEVDSTPDEGTAFRLIFPLTLSTRRVLIVEVDRYKYAIPVEFVQTTRLVSRDNIFSMEGRSTIVVEEQPLVVADLSNLLEIQTDVESRQRPPSGNTHGRTAELPCLILNIDSDRMGLFVDAVVDEQEVVLKSHGAVLRRVRNVSGSTILDDGDVCVVLNPHDLIRSVRVMATGGGLKSLAVDDARRKRILLAEDSIVTRTQEKRILESAGFDVVTAVDGQDAWSKLGTDEFDAIVSDVEMPNLTGLDLAERVRQHEQFKNLPIILVTSLSSDEDRQRGLDVGANAYLTKPGFDQRDFLDTVKRLA